ncbi:MAG: TrkA C-terminal domain-containing protein [Bacteroidales bacterium]|jgi:putative transport protein|nr:TrkA C-terminal domain-containing protein [Bacteroidales bacterium]
MEILHTGYGVFFLLTTIGIFLGKIKIKGISLDTSAIFFIALIFGYYDLTIPDIIQQIGLIFFMYSVGVQAGPGFFESFKRRGLQLLTLALTLSISGGALTIILAKLFGVDINMAVGLFTGSLTSASSLAVTIENTRSALPGIGFGIAFPFGVIGVVLITRLSPRIFRIDIKKEEQEYLKEIKAQYPKLMNKNFVAENKDIFDKTIGELNLRGLTNTNISQIYQKYSTINPKASTVIRKGDIIRACGTAEDLYKLKQIIGSETTKQIPANKKIMIRHFLVTNNKALNIPFGELALLQNYNATVTSIRRSGIDITPNANSRFRFGDKVTVAAPEENMKGIAVLVGDERKKLDELDFLPIVTGILLGILISFFKIPIHKDFSFSIGLTGGVLIAGLALSKVGRTGKIIWNISGTSNQFLRKLGLIFFLSGVGTDAGSLIIETIKENGINLFFIGVTITIIPMFSVLVVGKYLLKINFLRLLGALTGSMTSTPALSAIEPLTKTNAPQVTYAMVYPMALIIIIITSQLITLF